MSRDSRGQGDDVRRSGGVIQRGRVEAVFRLHVGDDIRLQRAVAHCEQVSDYVSRELFVDILESEEEHVDWLETQLSLIERVGLQNYLQVKIDGDD